MQARTGQWLAVAVVAGAMSLAGFGAHAAWADDRAAESSSKRVDDSAGATPDSRVDANLIATTHDDSAETFTAPQYVPALNSDRLIRMGGGPRFRIFYSTAFSQAYDNHLTGTLASGGQNLTSWNPTIGFVAHSTRAQYLFQYASTVSRLDNSASAIQAFHAANFVGRGEFSSKWGWDVTLSGWYGVDQVRFLAPLSFTNLLDIPTADTKAAVVRLGAQRNLNVSESAGLHWKPDARDRFSFSVYHSYSAFMRVPEDQITYVGLKTDYSRDLTRLATLHLYNNFGRDSRPDPCMFYDGGAGLGLRPTPTLTLDFGFGPTVGSLSCATRRGTNFRGSMGLHLDRVSSVYVSAARQSNVPVNLPHSQTSTIFSAGYSHEFPGGMTVRLDGGYLRLGSYATSAFVRAQGYFVSPQVDWKLMRSLHLNLAYRNMYQIVDSANLARNQVLLNLTWRPEPRGLYQ
jgi:hypothetical protein